MTSWEKENKNNKKLPVYEIRIQGRLDEDWSGWLADMSFSYEDNVTVLRGQVIDQAALRGVLSGIWDLNQKVISVKEVQAP